MRASRFDIEPKTALPWVVSLATGGMAAFFAAKSREEARRAELSERAERKIKENAIHDDLTGVLNKRGLRELLARNKPPRAMLYADSTHLKEVNDAYGHDRGDEAIIATADVLKASLRPGDIIARTGEGDEFLVLLDPEQREIQDPLNPEELLEHVTARISAETQDLLSQPENADLVEVGFDIAVGGAVWKDRMSVDDMRDAADTAMYKVKEAQHAGSRNGINPEQRVLF